MSNLAYILRDPTLVKYVCTGDSLVQPFSRPRWSIAYLAGRLIELRSTAVTAVLTVYLKTKGMQNLTKLSHLLRGIATCLL